MESKIRNCTKEALREAQVSGNVCNCQTPVIGGCRSCLMKQVSECLQNAGFNSAICKSKWKNLSDIPSGEHTFVDILDTNTKKGEVRVIVELYFRGEFEMAKASEEYNRLVSKLPEVFVGKVERLLSLTTILCSAAKKCMKDRKMHLGPWTKTRYLFQVNCSATLPPSLAQENLDNEFALTLAYILFGVISVICGAIVIARWFWIYNHLEKKILETLPKFSYSETAGKFSHCAICLTELGVLPQCGHGFHVGCVVTWLRTRLSCPVCRQVISVP